MRYNSTDLNLRHAVVLIIYIIYIHMNVYGAVCSAAQMSSRVDNVNILPEYYVVGKMIIHVHLFDDYLYNPIHLFVGIDSM